MNVHNDIKQFFNSGVLESPHFKLLLILIIVDIIIGTFLAITNRKLSSEIGLKGMIKHSTVILIAVVLGSILRLSGQIELSVMMGWFYVAEYGLSIVENLDVLGIPFPKWVTGVLNNVKKKGGNKDV